ncbi:flagellar filament capping protein FliD [Sedimentibacter saalensis]|jgi:flagellar hook-associated protein 2|uniref:Flagellar hook-associated protein 2 n=1 Tax=Sedimentibacter saalensis TaxID=130788 RepID=A0A562J6H4_9FIRM|nr:flagellar filament capping protein FliD [Sedimentibacter saalensis]TWH78710.1 flagellar capping protein FliD [Sedimentibacter saalensis]
MSTLSTSLYGSSTSKGFGGLVSGLDTDDLVNQMLSGTKSKINKAYQAKQKLLYKQQAYREISSKLVSFNNKYLSYSSGSKTNIMSSNFFKAYSFKSTSDYVNVSGDQANIQNFSIDSISSVADYASMTSTYKASAQSFSSDGLSTYLSSLAGDSMNIEYGGKSYKLTIDSKFGLGNEKVNLQDVADQLNSQIEKIADLNGGTSTDASDNVLRYSVSGDNRLVINSPEGTTTKLTAASNDVLEFLKMKVGEPASSLETETVDNEKLTRTQSDVFSNTSAYFKFDYNGVSKTIYLKEGLTDGSDLKSYLQTELDKSYGAGKVEVSYDSLDTKKLTFKTVDSSSNTNLFSVSGISAELSSFTGIQSGDCNRLNKTSAIGEAGLKLGLNETTLSNGNSGYAIKINDKLFEFEKSTSLNDIIKKINNDADAKVTISYLSTTDTFSIKADETGSNMAVKIEEVSGGNLSEALFGNATYQNVVNGKDTVMDYTLNGVKTSVVRSTANFSIDGINIELNKKSVGLTDVSFNVTNNADEVVERIKGFINDYNEIIELLNTKTKEKPNRDYQPLTPDQQDEMEEDEIKDWTEQARKGVLYGDSNMNSVLRKMRQAMTGKTSVSSLALSDIGISSASMDTSGKLVIDEEKLKAKLLESPDEIANLFSASTSVEGGISGIAVQMRELLVANVGAYGSSGILIDEAGLDSGRTSDKNNISKRIEDYDDKMAELKDKMEVERKRYWSKFTSLETTLNKLNSQSSYFTDMMG